MTEMAEKSITILQVVDLKRTLEIDKESRSGTKVVSVDLIGIKISDKAG
jgi:hypothetical protein